MSYFSSVRTVRRSLPAKMIRRLARLRNITGFVTIYGEDRDRRTALFARLWHVKRVAAVAEKLSNLNDSIDTEAVKRLAWLHDLNRWPFAHNSERGHFDQVANLDQYFKLDQEVSDKDIADLKGINRKDPDGISDQAKVVLLADVVTGMIEDPLLAVIGLNVHPSCTPPEIDDLLGYSLNRGELHSTCRDMTAKFHGSEVPLVARFNHRFHAVFYRLVERFLDEQGRGDLWSSYGDLLAISQRVKETFIREYIFPINNELVCRSAWLREEVIPWYFANCPGSTERLLEIDEREFVAEVTGVPGSPFSPCEFRPNLDIVRRAVPERAFIRLPHETPLGDPE